VLYLIYCTNTNRTRELVKPIQHGRECCKWLVKRLDEEIRILQLTVKNKLMIFVEKIQLKVYVNQHDSVSDIQTPSRSSFLSCFLHELLMPFTKLCK
jgi:hypothetical protein